MRPEIEAMAREAGIDDTSALTMAGELECFAKLVAKRCAEICDSMGDGRMPDGWSGEECGDRVRAEFGIERDR